MITFKELCRSISRDLQRSTENYVNGITIGELKRIKFREQHSENYVQRITFTKTFRELHSENNTQRFT